MARTSTFRTKAAIVSALNDMENTSRFLKLQLVEAGYLKAETLHKASRGRPQLNYVLTGKARGLLALAKNWGKIENVLAKATEVSETAEAA